MPGAFKRAYRPERQTKPNSSQRLIQHNYTPLALSPSPLPVQLHSSYLASPSLANHQGCSSPASSHSRITYLLPLIITSISHTAQPILSLLFPASDPSLCHHSISAAPTTQPIVIKRPCDPSQNITLSKLESSLFLALPSISHSPSCYLALFSALLSTCSPTHCLSSWSSAPLLGSHRQSLASQCMSHFLAPAIRPHL